MEKRQGQKNREGKENRVEHKRNEGHGQKF
jgi:hypothetical protein